MFIIEGNIGAGKSTFLKLAGQNLKNVTIDLEPVDCWQQQLFGQSLLGHFYTDPQRWAYTMETFTLMVRMADNIRRVTSLKDYQLSHATHTNNPADSSGVFNNLLVERSIYSGRYCFASNSHASGFMSDLEWGLYVQMFDFLTSKQHNPLYEIPMGFVYLRTSPEVAYQRTNQRKRVGESGIPVDYLSEISRKHDEFLLDKINLPAALQAVPVLVLDADTDFETNPAALQVMLDQLQIFIKNLKF